MKEDILVSIMLPMYNAEKYINECIDSILAQTYKNFELIIMDDGSTDNSAKLVKEYNDERIKYFYKEHTGIHDNMNCGIEKCNSKYIAIMNNDDYMPINRIELQIKFMLSHPEYSCISGATITYGTNSIDPYFMYGKEITINDLSQRNVICQPSVMLNIEDCKKIIYPIYDKEYLYEDYVLWVRLIIGGLKIYALPFVCNYYRFHASQASRNVYTKEGEKKSLDYIKRIIKEYNESR